jgi:hypothetical protein
MLGHVSRAQQPLVSGAIRQIFVASSAAEARARLGQVVDQLRAHAPKVARLLADAEADLLAFYGFPAEHWPKLRSTNPLERVTARSAGAQMWWDLPQRRRAAGPGRDAAVGAERRDASMFCQACEAVSSRCISR